jgi:DNA-directed RNA polymerase subunit RPC12/RpoP
MIKQAEWIKKFCDTEGFKFIDCDEFGFKVPCGLDKGYKENNHTIFVSGFKEGSKRIKISYGGLKAEMTLKAEINTFPYEAIKKHCIPTNFKCAKCGKKNLNLRTQDNHKTYDCPDCHSSSPDRTTNPKKTEVEKK